MDAILIVDDAPANRRLLRAVLEAGQFRVVDAADGVEALSILDQQPVQAIISDVLMPNMDGFRLCLEVRKHGQHATLPFIIYTSTYNSPSDRKLALDAGADDYIVKPASTAQLLAAIDRARARAAARQGRPVPVGDEVDVIKQYNAALVAKLEERNEELQHKNHELRASEERFRQLAENIHEVFWLTDPGRDTTLYVSPAYEKIWGRSVVSLLDRPSGWIEAIHPDDRERVRQLVRREQDDGGSDEEYRIVRPDGSVRWIRDRAFPVRDPEGHVYRVASVAEDITSRKELEEQFRHAQKMEAVGLLAGGVAHDFNNLLTVILMQAKLLQGADAEADEISEGLHGIHEAATRGASLTRQLLMFSRRETLRVRRLDLRAVVGGMLQMLRRMVGEHIAIEWQEPATPVFVRADAGMIEQVVMNLVINARDAMPQGGRIALALDETVVDEATAAPHPQARPGRFARLAVADSGTGIAPDVLHRIFDPFFTTKEVGRGTGLGLATVHGIVDQHAGWVDVQTAVGHGTTFSVHVPRDASEEAAGAAMVSAPVALHGHERLLVVEDDESLRRAIVRVLAQYGYQVFAAETAAAALRLWQEERGAIDLLLTDVILPGGMSGRVLAHRLQSEQPALAVLFSSGHREDVSATDFEAFVAGDFLPKPYEPTQLVAEVRSVLDRRNRAR